MQAEEKKTSSYLSGVAQWIPSLVPATLHELSTYIPEHVKKHIPNIRPIESEKESLLWASFEEIQKLGARSVFILLGLASGFQVWDLKTMKEVYSKRDVAVKSIQLWPRFADQQTDDIHFAILSADDNPNFPKNQLKIYSTKNGDYIDVVRFDSEIFSVGVGPNIVVVSLRDRLVGIDPFSRKEKFSWPCFPNRSTPYYEPQNTTGVLTIGTAWIGYSSPIAAPTPPRAHAQEHLSGIAKDFAHGLYALGDFGAKTVTSLVSSEPHDANGEALDKVAGTVIVKDIKSSQVIVHFRAHEKPLSLLRFDKSGTLIATASVAGNHINIFRLRPQNNKKAAQHLYKFSRGVTSAQIQDICFSPEGKWLAALSNRGTAHVFALNPTGGRVTTTTHTPTQEKIRKGHYRQRRASIQQEDEPIHGSPLIRIKDAMRFPPSNHSCHIGLWLSHEDTDLHLHLISNDSQLFGYKLLPRATTRKDVEANTLELDASEPREWNIGRHPSWREQLGSMALPGTETTGILQKFERSWMSAIDLQSSRSEVDYLQADNQITYFSLTDESKITSDTYYECVSSKLLQSRASDPVPSVWQISDLLIDTDMGAANWIGDSHPRVVKVGACALLST
eukprot:TRINITY_DN1300_c0_g1_i12.p1 TRINITY_DN1300_c0_g1~~TRINITY_DN1300_c0_g1_i12.p1  ORF type:complete len:618 (+),score=109.35 TRINITY_DN1300_c0_g1_i12:932-2785(+)